MFIIIVIRCEYKTIVWKHIIVEFWIYECIYIIFTIYTKYFLVCIDVLWSGQTTFHLKSKDYNYGDNNCIKLCFKNCTSSNLFRNIRLFEGNNSQRKTTIRTMSREHQHLIVWLWANLSTNTEDVEIHRGSFVNEEAKTTSTLEHVDAQLNEYIQTIVQVNVEWELFSYFGNE